MRGLMAGVFMTGALAGVSAAADAKQQFYIFGEAGLMTCATLSEKLNDTATGQALANWLAGYITALNRTTPDTFNLAGGPDLTALFAVVMDNCSKSPQSPVEAAVYVALDKAYAKRQVTGP